MMSRNFSSPLPDCNASLTFASAWPKVAARPAMSNIRVCQGHRQYFHVRRAAPLERFQRLDHLQVIADGSTQRRVHRRDHGLRPHPIGVAGGHQRLGQMMSTPRFFMNAPRPHFTSSTKPPMPSAIFLLMIDAVMSGMLSTVAVTSRRA